MLLLLTTKIASERLGHASVVITLDTYSHVLPTMQQDATEKLAGVLYGSGSC
jgi:integrase